MTTQTAQRPLTSHPALPALLLALSGLAFAGGCVSRPDPPRHFTPALPERAPVRSAGVAPLGSRSRLVLARLESSEHLDVRIVWRRSEVELGFYDAERWSEPPARFLEQALTRELFLLRPLRRCERDAPELSVRLLDFEEVLLPTHRARVRLAARLSDPQGDALFERVFTAEAPIRDEDASAMAHGLGVALDKVVTDLGLQVDQALAAQ